MTALERVERAASALKVFPLPSAVLFPNTVLPLVIFEPRYRSLVKS
ncbi:MAG: LON peptidase substrate-binding domain-containing protein, partial [Myxococcaceae bacterium]